MFDNNMKEFKLPIIRYFKEKENLSPGIRNGELLPE